MSGDEWLAVTVGGLVGWTLLTFAFVPEPDHRNRVVHRWVWGIGSAAWLTVSVVIRWVVQP